MHIKPILIGLQITDMQSLVVEMLFFFWHVAFMPKSDQWLHSLAELNVPGG